MLLLLVVGALLVLVAVLLPEGVLELLLCHVLHLNFLQVGVDLLGVLLQERELLLARLLRLELLADVDVEDMDALRHASFRVRAVI